MKYDDRKTGNALKKEIDDLGNETRKVYTYKKVDDLEKKALRK